MASLKIMAKRKSNATTPSYRAKEAIYNALCVTRSRMAALAARGVRQEKSEEGNVVPKAIMLRKSSRKKKQAAHEKEPLPTGTEIIAEDSMPESSKKRVKKGNKGDGSKEIQIVQQDSSSQPSSNISSDDGPKGLKLLKRGCVTMHRILRRKIVKEKITITFTDRGDPYGRSAAEMQSYIWVLARSKVEIWRKNWRQVPVHRKNKIWQLVKDAFVVPETYAFGWAGLMMNFVCVWLGHELWLTNCKCPTEENSQDCAMLSLNVPKQENSIECGYFVMRYMKEIMQDMDGMYVDKWKLRCGLKYS